MRRLFLVLRPRLAHESTVSCTVCLLLRISLCLLLQVLLRIREQGGAFEAAGSASRADDKLNDGNNYKGMMALADYKRRRTEVLEDPEEKKREAVASAKVADRQARDEEARQREEREAQRRERLKAQLAQATLRVDEEGTSVAADGGGVQGDASAGGAAEALGEQPKKKKKKKALAGEVGALSFDADEG